ncbi:phage portal protein [[Clostridium] symbiosum]|uniref:phage portal protein n=1 Tax=Clostridium symbiosum TaxID=1512 RepID=UPI0019219F98|nr:phage portal protein [[Clostridium] symbiosum]MDB2032477.1 phage portal protein [[Clostridium] symbiosum]
MKFTKMLDLITNVLNQDADTQVDVCLTSQMANQIELWTRMYENRAPWVNNKDVLSANLAPAIASEVARLVTLEMQSEITGSKTADYLNEQYKRKVLKDIRRYVEYGCAKGGLVLKPYVTQQGIEVQFIQADCFFPLSFDSSGRITQCAFTEQFRKGKKIYTRLEVHSLAGNRVNITNRAFVATNDYSLGGEVPVNTIDRWSELAPDVTLEGADRLLLGYFKMPLANAEDSDSPLGVSVYSRAVDLIKEADRRYSNICWEYEGTQLAVHIATSLLKYNQSRDKFDYPGGKERLYRNLEYNTGAVDKPFIDTFSPDIRDVSLFNGFNNQLKLVEFNSCLAYGTLSDPQSVDKTATEIKTSKQRSYVMVTDTQMALQDALEDLVYAMHFWVVLYNLAPAGKYEVSFDWDDSIIVDAELERQQDRQDLAAGIMRPEEYRAKWYGETLEEAVKNLPEPTLIEE